jgi:hypothetical protein
MQRLTRVLSFSCAVWAVGTTNASAQPAVNLTGTYRCVQGCAPSAEGMPAFVTQNGWNINIVTETGIPVQAWFDWYAPMTRIWMEALNQGAIFSPDGMTIQSDRGTVWQRDLGPQIAPDDGAVAYCTQRYRSYDPVSRTYLGNDRRRHSCP